MVDLASNLFNAGADPNICAGSCVVINNDGKIIYVGPIGNLSSEVLNAQTVLLNPADFERLKAVTKRHQQ